MLPENGYEYGLDEDSPKPYSADGFVQSELHEVGRWLICRFDSMLVRGFSSAVAFTRIERRERMLKAQRWEPDNETLEQSWERMQRSLSAGRAQSLPVQLESRMTSC